MSIQNLFSQEIVNLNTNPTKRQIFHKLLFKESWSVFSVKNRVGYFLEQSGASFDDKSNDAFVNKVKVFIKKSPKFFSFVYHFMNPSFAKVRAKTVLEKITNGGIIFNLGSGATSLREDVVNVDFFPFENVDFVADVCDLPFSDNIADAMISECVLEHTPDPDKVVSEMYRVLKPGGLVYVVVPFVFSFHSSPYDFYRWSKMGIGEQFKDFDKIDSGIHFGSGNALNWILAEYFATLFSFGVEKLHQVLFILFLILFVPLGYLDFILNKFNTSQNIASHVYYLGKKK
jgi:SAM-dependent methyltransferase